LPARIATISVRRDSSTTPGEIRLRRQRVSERNRATAVFEGATVHGSLKASAVKLFEIQKRQPRLR
jgi:hypothetical protein